MVPIALVDEPCKGIRTVQAVLKSIVAAMCFLLVCLFINIVANIIYRTLHNPISDE